MKDYLLDLRPSTFGVYEHVRTTRKARFFLTVVFFVLVYYTLLYSIDRPVQLPADVIVRREQILEHCKYINTPAGPPPNFYDRTHSDRYVPGTKPVWLKNAKIWTGSRNGTEFIYGDIVLDKGLIQAVGYIPPQLLGNPDLQVEDVKGAWITPGLVDLHSHIGVDAAPWLRGAADTNSRKAPILPWLRSIDALNTHDASYDLAISGGVTTCQVLPGSANNIGGQSFVIKLRPTSERSSRSKVIEPPYTLNGTHFDHSLTPRWRHMKHACGENPSRVYSQTRMDSAWEFRQAYNTGRKLKESQDQFCAKAEAGLWSELRDFPEDLQWEALVDVLRGKVKLSVHCYEAVDLDAIVRLSNEFQFPIASFHHAGETYLVPNLLKNTWGGVPSIALFATNAREKREAYRNSEFAMRVLADHGIPVVMKSDHPVVNSRYLLNEAAMAHFYGLNPGLALTSVTSTPAAALGLGHRVGTIREGYDADIVVWDSHPLALGATPKQVYIDGIPQLEDPQVSSKPDSFQDLPKIPNFDRERKAAVRHDGLPPLTSRKSRHVMFINVSSLYTKNDGGIDVVDFEDDESQWLTVVVTDGIVTCADSGGSCHYLSHDKLDVIDLQGGSLVPGLTTFGSPLGLVEIRLEPSTNDGKVYDPLEHVPSIIGDGEQSVIRAVDGLQFGGRNTLLAYRDGVTTAITAPSGDFLLGFSTAFATGANNALEKNAIIQDEVALHVAVARQSTGGASVSTQIAALRHILFEAHRFTSTKYYNQDALDRLRKGDIPLVVHVDSADIMASLLHLKAEYDHKSNRPLRLTFAGATEAHLLAKEIGDAGVSVILTPSRPFPHTWDQRRIMPGPPLSHDSAVTALLARGVNVAIGVVDEYAARNTRFDLAWAALESNGQLGKAQAIALATTNIEKALGLSSSAWHDIVAFSGGDIFDFRSKVVGVVSAQRRIVDIFD